MPIGARWREGAAWSTTLGLGFFVAMMAVGYYYNVTFVQLGLTDLGTRILGLDRDVVAGHMAVLAIVTCGAALTAGVWMRRDARRLTLRSKLRIAFVVVLAQTLLTAATAFVGSEAVFLAWLVLAGCAIGVGVPATFGLTVDLVPTRHRGAAAAAITAIAYFAAPLFSGDWTLEFLMRQMLVVMVPGVLALGVIAFVPLPLVERWARQHHDPGFRYGRYARPGPDGVVRVSGRLIVLVVLMFGVFFIDSLGFLRLVDTPTYMVGTWQSSEVAPRLTIAIAHVIAAVIAGVLYRALGERHLLTWVFGLFALIHLSYVLGTLVPGGGGGDVLATPVLYAVAVSLYTVVAFAIWADLSTPETITVNAALGVAASAWTATFLSTALALRWHAEGVPFGDHLRAVEALALLFFVAMLVLVVAPRRSAP